MLTWKNKVLLLSLKHKQQFASVKGKNASDISLIIDALTILFKKRIDVFCLAYSDSDYDVRFLYVGHKDFYLKFEKTRNIVEYPIDAVLD